MKNINRYIAGGVLLMALVSCDGLNETPVFDDADAFAAFTSEAVTVDEDAGTVSIPVTIASTNPVRTSIAYTVTDGSAVQNKNYSLADASAVLAFDGETRTQNIVINITNVTDDNAQNLGYESGYTGNLTFTVTLVSAGSLKLGAESSCSVTIRDLNHPLSSIVGTYTATATDNFDGNAGVSWTLNLMTDESDDSMIWIDAITPFFEGSYPAADGRYYGTVSDDLTTITIPCGQHCAYQYGGLDIVLFNFDGSGIYSSGNIVFTQTSEGVFTCEEQGIFIGTSEDGENYSGWNALNPGITWTKQQ